MGAATWDYESISRTDDPLAVILHLTDATSKPNFSLSRQCSLCDAWDRGCRLGVRPKPPGARNPVKGCDGCWFSHLDQCEPHEDGQAEFLLARMIEGLDAIPAAHEKRREEHKQRIRDLRRLISKQAPRQVAKRGRVLALHLEVT